MCLILYLILYHLLNEKVFSLFYGLEMCTELIANLLNV